MFLLCLFSKGQLQLLLTNHPVLQGAVHIGFSRSANFNTQASLLPPVSPLCHFLFSCSWEFWASLSVNIRTTNFYLFSERLPEENPAHNTW